MELHHSFSFDINFLSTRLDHNWFYVKYLCGNFAQCSIVNIKCIFSILYQPFIETIYHRLNYKYEYF